MHTVFTAEYYIMQWILPMGTQHEVANELFTKG